MKHRLYTILVPVLAIFFCNQDIIAQEIEDDEEALLGLFGDEAMISIATGSRQSIARAPAVASVISSADIESMGAVDIDDVLETIPGLHIGKSNIGYNPIYLFRGIYSSFNPQVLMLINGVPITNLQLGDRGQSWGGMPVDAISRIEIIRGPGSAVYGADAFAGVINIIIKSAEDISDPKIKLRAGSFDSANISAEHKKEWGGFKVGIVAEYYQTDGHGGIIDADTQTNLDTIFGTDASLAPGPVTLTRRNYDLRLDIDKGEWRFRSGVQRRHNWGVGAGVAEALDPNNRYNSDKINADLSWHKQSPDNYWDLTAQLSYLDTSHEIAEDLIVFPPGVTLREGTYPNGFIGNPEVFEKHYRANFTASYSGVDNHNLRFGTGYYLGDLYKTRETKNFGLDPITRQPLPPDSPLVDVSDTDLVFLPEDDRENIFLFVQDIWSLAPDWELTAGVRFDDYSDFGSTTNPRLALVWSTSHKLTTKLLYSQAFRAPSFGETRNINNPVALGNPNLRPEVLESYEIAFDYRTHEDINFLLNIFQYRWEDIIQFVPDMGTQSATAQNEGEQTGQGLEVELHWKVSKSLHINTNFSAVDAENDIDGTDVINAPQKQFFISSTWNITNNSMLYSQINYVMDRQRDPSDQRSQIDDYSLVDINFRYTGFSHFRFSASVKNVFDEDAREPSIWSSPTANIPNDLPLAGRHFYLQVEYLFK